MKYSLHMVSGRILLILAVAIGATTVAPGDEPAFVVAGPETRSAIIIDSQWKPQVWYDHGGHAILARYAKMITGRDVPVVKSDDLTDEARQRYDFRIWIGRQPEVERALGPQLDELDDDGFIIRGTPRDLYVSGKRWWGTNWAVHDLLERFAGCRWYLMEWQPWRPGEQDAQLGPGDIIPKAESIGLPADTDIVAEPDYKSRWFRVVPTHSFRVRMRDRFHHHLWSVLPPEEYFDRHPEFFPELGGRRYRPQHEQDFQPCVSNVEVVTLVAEHVIRHFDERPEVGSFSLGMNDTGRFCECRDCLAAAPPEIEGKPARIAWAFFDFYNRVARRVAEKHPDRRLGCLAYAGLRALPAGSIELHPMIVPYLTLDSAQLHDSDQVVEFRETSQQWAKKSRQMGIYEYMYGGGFVIPRIYNRYLAANIKDRYGVGADGFYAEAYPNWGLDGPKYWLVSKLLWDTSLDPEALLDQFYRDMFGPAAGAMREYFDFLEETWCSQTLASNRSNYRWWRDPRQLEIFPPDKCDRAWTLIERAERLAPGEAVRSRIAFFKKSFAVTRALSKRYAAAGEADALAANRPDELAGILTAIEAWLAAGDLDAAVEDARKLGFSAFSTTGPDELEQVKTFDRQPNRAVDQLVGRLVDAALTVGPATTADELRTQIDRELAMLANEPAVPHAQEFVGRLARERGALFIPNRDEPPQVDGRIDAGQWGPPLFDQSFFPVVHVGGQTSSVLDQQVPERTRVWGIRHGDELFLAFDMQQDPETIGGRVTDRDTTHWRDADMLQDDCIVLNFFRPGTPFQHVRVNARGAVSDFAGDRLEWDAAEARVGRTHSGWQAEIRLDLTKLNIHPNLDDRGPAVVSIARYTRRPDPNRPGGFRTEASTLMPFPYLEGHIGRGNHPQLMVFATGVRMVFEPEIRR